MRKNKHSVALTSVAFAILWSCVHSESESEGPIAPDYIAKFEAPAKPSEEAQAPIVDDQSKLCRRVITEADKAITALQATEGRKSIDTGVVALAKLDPASCEGRGRRKTYAAILHSLSRPGQKIGLILPLSGPLQTLGEAVNGGIKAFCGDSEKCSNAFIVRDDRGTEEGARASLVSLVTQHEIGLIIGGLSPESASGIVPFAQKLIMPMLILNKNSDLIKKSPYTMQVFPRQENLAWALAQEAQRRNIQRVSILQPESGAFDYLCSALAEELKKADIGSQVIPYKSADYNSMTHAARTIAGTDPEVRKDEVLLLQQKALSKGRRESAISLKPRPISDAVFIPENYRIVRHFLNLLKFQGLAHPVLMGNNEWRSSSLLAPWDKTLKGAFFADFVGSYNAIPKALVFDLDESEFFVKPNQIISVDFQLVGYRAAGIATKALATKNYKRHETIGQLMKLKHDSAFFPVKRAFNPDRTINWPTYILEVGDQAIMLYP